MGANLLRIKFSEVYRIIKNCDGTRYLELFGSGSYNIVGEKK